MDADEFYKGGGKYLKGADIKGQEWELTILNAVPEDGYKGGPPRIALSFEEIEAKLTLNKGNYEAVKETLGTSETDKWIGKQIVLYGTRDLNPGGEMVDVVRVRLPEREVKRTVPGKKGSGPSDKVPF